MSKKVEKHLFIAVASVFLFITIILVVIYFTNEYNRFHFDIGYAFNFNSEKIASITSIELYSDLDMSAKTDSDFTELSFSGSSKSISKEILKIFNSQETKKYTKRSFDYDMAIVIDGVPEMLINTDKNYGFICMNNGIMYTFYFELAEDVKQMILSGCISGDKTESALIDFEYFYRGFTPVVSEQEDINFETILGTYLIKSEEDWQAFSGEFCPTAGAIETPDFSEKCLIVVSDICGSRAHENISREIGTVKVVDNEIIVTTKDSTSMSVYAINTNGIGHLFINVIVVDRSEIPENISNTFSKE